MYINSIQVIHQSQSIARWKVHRLREHGGSREGCDLVNHDLEIASVEGLDLGHGVLRAVIEGIGQDAGSSHTSCALHAVSDGTGVGEIWEFLAEIHELNELCSVER